MKPLFSFLRKKPLSILVLALPLALLAELGGWGPVWVFVFSALTFFLIPG